jgi:hypothetical protein
MQAYKAAFTSCVEGKGLSVGGSLGAQIFQILEAGGSSAGTIAQQIEGAAVASGIAGAEAVVGCVVDAWLARNPVAPNVAPTPAQAAARVYQVRHAAK